MGTQAGMAQVRKERLMMQMILGPLVFVPVFLAASAAHAATLGFVEDFDDGSTTVLGHSRVFAAERSTAAFLSGSRRLEFARQGDRARVPDGPQGGLP